VTQTKNMMALVSDILKNFRSISPALTDPARFIKQTIHEEILQLSFKLLGSIILTSMIIFSIISLGQQLNLLLLSTESGPYLAIVLYGTLITLGSFGLRHFLIGKSSLQEIDIPQQTEVPLMTPQQLLIVFAEGLAEGLLKGEHVKQEGSQKMEPPLKPPLTPESHPHQPNNSIN
jgi:hypothetical protein